jgi:hypothetical protein
LHVNRFFGEEGIRNLDTQLRELLYHFSEIS